LLWDDPNHEKAAASIAAEWNAIERLSHSDVVSAVKQLGITQRELARGTGLSEDWLSLVILGKEVMSASTELKIRYYVEDVSEGKTPMPKMKDQLWPQYRNPKDIPLTEGIVSALAVHPMTSEALTELTIWLASLGITQMKLSEWWCLNYNNVRDMRAGRRKISTRSANRLRELFGLPPVVIDYTPPKIPEFGAIPAPPEIQSLLERRKIGKQEVQAVIDYLQLNYGFESTKLSRRLGYGKQYVSSVVHGYISVNHIFAKRLRSLFAFAQTGGAE
jgi:plasmid maintenance system antidote protein VapI